MPSRLVPEFDGLELDASLEFYAQEVGFSPTRTRYFDRAAVAPLSPYLHTQVFRMGL